MCKCALYIYIRTHTHTHNIHTNLYANWFYFCLNRFIHLFVFLHLIYFIIQWHFIQHTSSIDDHDTRDTKTISYGKYLSVPNYFVIFWSNVRNTSGRCRHIWKFPFKTRKCKAEYIKREENIKQILSFVRVYSQKCFLNNINFWM